MHYSISFYLLSGLLRGNCITNPQNALVFSRGSDAFGLDPAHEKDGEPFKALFTGTPIFLQVYSTRCNRP